MTVTATVEPCSTDTVYNAKGSQDILPHQASNAAIAIGKGFTDCKSHEDKYCSPRKLKIVCTEKNPTSIFSQQSDTTTNNQMHVPGREAHDIYSFQCNRKLSYRGAYSTLQREKVQSIKEIRRRSLTAYSAKEFDNQNLNRSMSYCELNKLAYKPNTNHSFKAENHQDTDVFNIDYPKLETSVSMKNTFNTYNNSRNSQSSALNISDQELERNPLKELKKVKNRSFFSRSESKFDDSASIKSTASSASVMLRQISKKFSWKKITNFLKKGNKADSEDSSINTFDQENDINNTEVAQSPLLGDVDNVAILGYDSIKKAHNTDKNTLFSLSKSSHSEDTENSENVLSKESEPTVLSNEDVQSLQNITERLKAVRAHFNKNISLSKSPLFEINSNDHFENSLQISKIQAQSVITSGCNSEIKRKGILKQSAYLKYFKAINSPKSSGLTKQASVDQFLSRLIIDSKFESMPLMNLELDDRVLDNSDSFTNLIRKECSFSPTIRICKTWAPSEYDRRSENATCSSLTPLIARRIKEELNLFKAEEMIVHKDARCPSVHDWCLFLKNKTETSMSKKRHTLKDVSNIRRCKESKIDSKENYVPYDRRLKRLMESIKMKDLKDQTTNLLSYYELSEELDELCKK